MGVGWGGGTPCNVLYEDAPPEKGTFFVLHVYKRVGIAQVGAYERVGHLGMAGWQCHAIKSKNRNYSIK